MPRGGKRGHKGQRRQFTSPEQISADKEKEERQKNWRKTREGPEDEDEDEENSHESSEEESESDDESGKAKGVAHLIEVSNPNRVANKAKKMSRLDDGGDDEEAKPQLSRREREELEKQQAKAKYNALHAAGKTDEARADLARLAIIRQQREEAAKKKELAKKEEERKAEELKKAKS